MTTATPSPIDSLHDASLPMRHAPTEYLHPAGERGFDFFHGQWIGSSSRMLKPLSGENQWETFEGFCDCRPVLGGIGNVEEFRTPHRPGFVGMALRLFDPQEGCWRIYWMDNRSKQRVEEPVAGRFVGNAGVFECNEDYEGRPIMVRFIWSRLDTPTPRWEQAFSADGGRSWETNWITDFRRATAGDAQ